MHVIVYDVQLSMLCNVMQGYIASVKCSHMACFSITEVLIAGNSTFHSLIDKHIRTCVALQCVGFHVYVQLVCLHWFKCPYVLHHPHTLTFADGQLPRSGTGL